MIRTILLVSGLFIAAGVFGQTWNQVTVPTDKKLNDIDFPTDQVGYIGGDEGVLLKTTDGGANWSVVNYSGITATPPYNIIDIEFADANTGYMVLDYAFGLYKTTDGGMNWIEDGNFELGNICYKKSLFVFDQDHIFLGGSGCFQGPLIKEFEAPLWSEKSVDFESFDPAQFVVDLDFSGNYALATTNTTYMLRSVDNGQTWDTIPTPLNNGVQLTEVLIVSDTLAFAGYIEVGVSFGILRSDDMGLTWYQDMNSATFFYPDFLSLTKSNDGTVYIGSDYAAGNDGLIFSTSDALNWWYDQVDEPIHAMDSYGTNVTWGVGDSGYVVVNTDLASLGLDDQPEHAIDGLSLYPNPATDIVTLSVAGSTIAEIFLVDNWGRILLQKQINSDHTSLDVSKLSPGMYHVMVVTGNGERLEAIIAR